MKIIYLTLIFIIFNCTLSSKSTTKHTEEPSPLEFKLHDNRFVPSTKSQNLVWADQIIPTYITEKQIEFAANNFVGTQKIWDHQIKKFRAYNENFLGLIYHLAVGLNPLQNDDCPNPKSNSGTGYIGVVSPKGYVSEWNEHFIPWIERNNIDINSNRFESMFQHWDSLDYDYRVWHKDPYWLMDISNEDWQDYIIEQTLNWMEGNQDEGCFFDVSVETYAYLYNPKSSNPSPYNFNWWQSPQKPENSDEIFNSPSEFANWMNELYLNYYQRIYSCFHKDSIDYLVIPNVDQMVTTVYDPVWMDGNENGETIDGAMIEGFGNYRGSDMYLTLERCIRHLTGRGKILIAQFDADSQAERYRRTAMYMMVKNENSFININPTTISWYPEYDINLGDQYACPENIAQLQIQENVWQRMYDSGRVICNTSDRTVDIDPLDHIPEVYFEEYIVSTSGGGEIDEKGNKQSQEINYEPFTHTYKLAPSECVILEFKNYTDIKENIPNNQKDIKLHPNPAKEELYIDLSNITSTENFVEIYNQTGILVHHSKTKSANKTIIDISSLTNGVYFINLRYNDQVLHKKFTIIR